MVDLEKIGFKNIGCCNNREFYTNGIIDIIEHNGTYYLDKNDGNFYSDVEFKTNKSIFKYLDKLKKKYETNIEGLKNIVNNIDEYERLYNICN